MIYNLIINILTINNLQFLYIFVLIFRINLSKKSYEYINIPYIENKCIEHVYKNDILIKNSIKMMKKILVSVLYFYKYSVCVYICIYTRIRMYFKYFKK